MTSIISPTDEMQAGVQGYSWCATLFLQIQENLKTATFVPPESNLPRIGRQHREDALRQKALRCIELAQIGQYLADTFGNDLDVAREELEEAARANGGGAA